MRGEFRSLESPSIFRMDSRFLSSHGICIFVDKIVIKFHSLSMRILGMCVTAVSNVITCSSREEEEDDMKFIITTTLYVIPCPSNFHVTTRQLRIQFQLIYIGRYYLVCLLLPSVYLATA